MASVNLQNTYPLISYTATGVQSTFTFPYLVYNASDLSVYVNGVLQTSGYTVNGLGIETGGSVTFTTNPGSVATPVPVFLIRNTARSRTVQLTTAGAFKATSYNQQQNQIIAMIQELARNLDYKVGIPLTSVTAAPSNLTFPSPSANYAIGWDSTGTTLVNIATASQIANAQTYATNAAASASQSSSYATASQGYSTNAQTYAGNAYTYMQAAQAAGYNPANVAITGGTINGVTIGSTAVINTNTAAVVNTLTSVSNANGQAVSNFVAKNQGGGAAGTAMIFQPTTNAAKGAAIYAFNNGSDLIEMCFYTTDASNNYAFRGRFASTGGFHVGNPSGPTSDGDCNITGSYKVNGVVQTPTIIQEISSQANTYTAFTGLTAGPVANSVNQLLWGQGALLMSGSITPKSSTNKIVVETAQIVGESTNTSDNSCVGIFIGGQTSTNPANSTSWEECAYGTDYTPGFIPGRYEFIAGTTAPISVNIRGSNDGNATTLTWNGAGGVRVNNGQLYSYLKIIEKLPT